MTEKTDFKKLPRAQVQKKTKIKVNLHIIQRPSYVMCKWGLMAPTSQGNDVIHASPVNVTSP